MRKLCLAQRYAQKFGSIFAIGEPARRSPFNYKTQIVRKIARATRERSIKVTCFNPVYLEDVQLKLLRLNENSWIAPLSNGINFWTLTRTISSANRWENLLDFSRNKFCPIVFEKKDAMRYTRDKIPLFVEKNGHTIGYIVSYVIVHGCVHVCVRAQWLNPWPGRWYKLDGLNALNYCVR